MNKVIVESPYAGNIALNVAYTRAAMRDCLMRGESPYASHLLYTQPGILKDGIPEERRLGIDAGFVWRSAAVMTVVYTDLGITPGMQEGIDHAAEIGHHVEFRRIGVFELLGNFEVKEEEWP